MVCLIHLGRDINRVQYIKDNKMLVDIYNGNNQRERKFHLKLIIKLSRVHTKKGYPSSGLHIRRRCWDIRARTGRSGSIKHECVQAWAN